MDASKQYEPQTTSQAANLPVETRPITRAGRTASELLEDSGNRRQIITNLHPLSESLFSEQQKLRHVLDWAQSFLSSGSEVHHELCRADSLILANEERKKSPVYKNSSAAKYHHAISCTTSGNDVLGGRGGRIKKVWQLEPSNYENSGTNNLLYAYKPPFLDDPSIPFSFSSGRDEVISTEFRETPENMKSMELQDDTNKQTPELQTRASDGATCLELMREKTEDAWTQKRKEKVNEEEEQSESVFVKSNISNSEHERALEQVEKPPKLGLSCHLTVYEQYQLYVDQLHRLRVRQSQHIGAGCITEPPAEERKTKPKKTTSDIINKNNKNKATLTECEHCDDVTVKETPAADCAESRPVTSSSQLDLRSNKYGELMKGTAATNSRINMERLRTAPGDNVPAVETRLVTKPGLFPKRIRRNQSGVKGQKKKASLRLCEKSSVSSSSLTNKEKLQRPQGSSVKRQTPEDKMKPASAFRDTHKCLPPTETRTSPHDNPEPTSPALGRHEQTDSPAGAAVCTRWLCLPDEVWLSVLSLLPHTDLCRVMQVCRRLHALATDHTLWKNLSIEHSSLTERWLLGVGRRRPRSLCLYSCSAPSLSSCGLRMFFTQCRNFLEELKVTSCTGPGLHGDQMLALIGELCDHVTSVDVSWSGATDAGVKALSDCSPGLKLKSVVLNGCHVTDDPLNKLVMRHKQSLCRLEVFGCQFLSPSCLQTVYEMCPGLQHLNIGQVPKVNAHSLTVMTSQLKCLISLNVTGLQAVTDASVDTLLQNCVELQSLTLSSCPGVTDRTLHGISKYTPCIRALDVSGCAAVTDAGVQSLALGCRRLEQLDLSSTGTGNRGVTLLANYCSAHLQTVKLSFCHITSEIILKLCRRCRRLKVLHLYGCTCLPAETEIRQVNAAVKVYPLP